MLIQVIMNTLTTMNGGAYHVDWKVLDTQERVAMKSTNEPAKLVYLGLNLTNPHNFVDFVWGG